MSKRNRTPLAVLRHLATALGLTVAAGAAAATILTTSSAAFSVTTQNSTDNWKIGGIQLTDDDSDAAMFTVQGMVPGQTNVHCITVTYNGDAASITPIKLYTSNLADTDGITPYLDVTIEQGSGGSFADCTGFSASSALVSNQALSAFNTAHNSFATGLSTFTPSTAANQANVNQPVSFRFTVTLNNSVPQTKMGKSASVDFVWEIQTL